MMKMRKPVYLFLLLIVNLSVQAQNNPPDTILLFNPTVGNINTISYLLEKDILDLDAFHFKGVYHADASYDYSMSENYLEENPKLRFSLFEINKALPGDMIFAENSCSESFRQLFNTSEGAVFLGGPDIPPHTYNEPLHLLTRVTDPARHYLELSYLFHILGGNQNPQKEALMINNPQYGVMGICLGMQSINVATGGTMIQDIPQEIYGFSLVDEILESENDMVHRNYYPDDVRDDIRFTGYHFHKINFTQEGNIFSNDQYSNNNEFPYVLSAHHQAIEILGKGLKTVASSMDGKIREVIVHEDFKNVIGVQFHPEKTGLYNSEAEFHVNSDSIINFNRFIIDNKAYDFHLNLWKKVSEIFQH